MKRNLLMFFLLVLFASCSEDKKPAVEVKGDDVAVQSINTAVDEKTKKMEELKKLSPLTLEQMKILLPAEIEGVKQSNFSASVQFGYGMASAEYLKKRTEGLKVTLYDCAGDVGSVFYMDNFWNNTNVQKETENGFTKSVDFVGGGKAIQDYKNDIKLSTMSFTIRDRLLVVVEGNMPPDQLMEKAKMIYSKIA